MLYGMVSFAIVAALSIGVTTWLNARVWGRWLLLLARWALVVMALGYAALFFWLYRPNAWVPIAGEAVEAFTRMHPVALGILGGSVAGTAFIQFFFRGL